MRVIERMDGARINLSFEELRVLLDALIELQILSRRQGDLEAMQAAKSLYIKIWDPNRRQSGND
jgi:hypothetical protein